MLIYNHQQKFVGIDAKDLKSLGFKNLAELQSECNDFADLFVNRPTYIHNFKNFNWIYYILNSDIGEAKVIINAKNREFSATIEIEVLYLTDAPSENAYAITLTKLRALDGKEIEQSKVNHTLASTEKVGWESSNEDITNLENEKAIILSEPDPFETPPVNNIINDPYDFDFNAPLEIQDIYLHHDNEEKKLDMDNDFEFSKFEEQTESLKTLQEETKAEKTPDKKVKPMLGDYTISSSEAQSEYINNLQVSKDYTYNPQVAADELGLPIDLIEEFIGDFIQQSYDFKNELYIHLANDELSDVKLLSHKLKGVAANLRIEDAFEVLSIVNTSSNTDEIKATLDHFYKIISKLEGKEVQEESQEEKISNIKLPSKTEVSNEDDLFLLKEIEEKEKSIPKELPIESDDDIYDFGLKFDDDEPIILEESSLQTINMESLDNTVTSLQELSETPKELKIPEKTLETLDYDKLSAVNELGLSTDFIEELLGDFKEQTKTHLQSLETAIETNNKDILYDIVMNIKGTADNLRITKISKTLEDLLFIDDQQKAKQLLILLKNYINQL
jgi:HPt (histidine-containing phosphotransfer) domain-containing protein